MYCQNVAGIDDTEPAGTEGLLVDETLEVESIELVGPSSTETCAAGREELQRFLVACFQASVSIETMSRHLGIDPSTIRSELRHGIAAWNAAQRRPHAAASKPQLMIVAPSA